MPELYITKIAEMINMTWMNGVYESQDLNSQKKKISLDAEENGGEKPRFDIHYGVDL
jgi:hypothetical protein